MPARRGLAVRAARHDYAPERIPEEFRHAHARRGLALDRSELRTDGGFNMRHHNALAEGGPRNGVLTAVEDFVAQSGQGYRLFTVPGFHGLGVLYAPDHVSAEAAQRLPELLDPPAHVRAHLEALEKERLHLLLEVHQTHALLGGGVPGPRLAGLLRAARRLKRLGRDPGGP